MWRPYNNAEKTNNTGLGNSGKEKLQAEGYFVLESKRINCLILYITRKLSEQDAHYSTVEECQAIQQTVDSLHYYLLGWLFTLCSDHAVVQWLHCMKDAVEGLSTGFKGKARI